VVSLILVTGAVCLPRPGGLESSESSGATDEKREKRESLVPSVRHSLSQNDIQSVSSIAAQLLLEDGVDGLRNSRTSYRVRIFSTGVLGTFSPSRAGDLTRSQQETQDERGTEEDSGFSDLSDRGSVST
jgi:hypothetical protein